MKIERNLLIIFCGVILLMFTFHKQTNIENFISSCKYYDIDAEYGQQNELLQQIGKPGLDVMNEKLSNYKYRAGWIRKPSPVHKYSCDNSGCSWKQIYKNFYPDLRGDQENMITP